jgi:hypothetical protein
MTYLDAAVAVLSERAVPMTVEEITESALLQGLISTTGRTPVRSMSAALYLHVLRKGSRVERVARQGPVRAHRGSVRWRLVKG